VESDAPFVFNTATATGTDPLGGTVTGIDNCTINVRIAPDIAVVKTASLTGSCPGSDPLAVSISDTVTYCFNVTNTGDVNLTGVTVVDDIYGSVTLGTTTLAPGESTEGTITHVVVGSDAPSVTNIATATGTDPLGGTVTDTDPCTINVRIAPDIAVVKTASLTGTCPGSDPLAVNISDTVTYCFNVSNTGDVNLIGVTVNDDIYGPVTLGTSTLAPGETTEGTLTHVVVESDAPFVINTATATGTDPLGGTVIDTDPCTINVALAPGISMVKTASLTGACPGSDSLAVSIGDTVTYCFIVINTGDVTLTNVAVLDNIYGPVTLGTTSLAPGETTEGTLTHVVVESDVPSVTNTATATGTDPLGGTVTDTDPCTINVAIAPGIAVVKTASLTGSCPGSDPLAVSIGDTVTYCFNVTNTGDVNLIGVTVNDNVYGPVTLGTTTLAPGESTGGTITHIVVGSDAPSVTDIATATGTDPLGGTVTDTDPCTINVALAPEIEVVKTASLTGSCPGSDPLAVSIGNTVTYCFNVSNTGDVNLIGVTVIDDIYGPVTLGTTTLAPGESTLGTITHVVVESDAPSVTNTAIATGTDPLGGSVTDTDPCTINLALAPDIAITKTANVSSATVGTVIGYTITVNNTGNVNLTNVLVTDVKLGLSQTIPNLIPNASQTFSPSYTVTQADICAPIYNTATANGTDPCGGAVGPESASVSVPTRFSPSLAITKTANVSSATVGTVIGYNITVNNTGNVNLTNVLVTDSLTGLSETIPLLTPGASQTFNPSYTVTQADICAPINNTATANGTDPCGGAVGPESATVSVPTSFSPSLAITKTANVSSATVGSVIGYTINVANTGNVNLISVRVTDSLTGLSETIPTLAPGATQTFNTIYIVTESDICGVIENTATANATDPCGYPLMASSVLVVHSWYNADLSIVKTAALTGTCPGSDPLAVNISDTVTYCFIVSNTGDVTLTSVTVIDDVYGPVTLGTTTLAPGETTEGTITHVVVVSDAPSVTNTATANGTDPCGVTVTNTDPCTINVAIAPGIEVVKTASLTGTCPGSDPLAVSIGDTVTYCFIVSNTGDVSLTSVTVNDDIYGSVTLGTTTLAPGETTEGTITHIVVGSDAPSVTDTATATGTPPAGAEVTGIDDCTIDVAIAPGIEVVKTASLTGTCPGSDPLAVNIGDTVTYCFNVTNTGDVTLSGITVNDDIYGSVTLGTTTLAPSESTEGTLTHIVVGSDAPSVTDTATAMGTDPLDGTVTDTDPCTINVAIAPDIAITKTANVSSATVGTVIGYTITVNNTGNVNLTNVLVTDSLTGLSETIPTLIPNASRTFSPTFTVTQADICAPINNTATANGTDSCGGAVGPYGNRIYDNGK
jgi:uncharacterized repeat protein (TIGR01451 family)